MQEDEKLHRLVELAEKIILRYVEDKFEEKISTENLKDFIEKTKFILEFSHNSNIAGTYHAHPNKNINMPITVNGYIFKYNLLDALWTIIHEMQHKFSNEISTGEIPSNQIEEGMADLFAEECINYFLQVEPQTLQDFANGEGMRYKEGVTKFATKDDYSGELELVKAIFETIRQTTGKNYNAEFEYTFGNKEAFMEIVKESLGNECVELIAEQKKDKKGLGGKYNLKYNERLFEILDKIPLYYEKGEDGETKKREDGTFNVYMVGSIKKIANKQQIVNSLSKKGIDVYHLMPENLEVFKKAYQQVGPDLNGEFFEKILQGYLESCTDITQLNSLLDLNNTFESELMKNPQFLSKLDTKDILKTIGNWYDNLEMEENSFTDEFIEQLVERILKTDIKELTEEEINGIAYLSLQTHKPNIKISEILSRAKDNTSLTFDSYLKIEIGRIRNSKGPKGHEWTELLKKYCSCTDKSENLQQITQYLLFTNVQDYLENDAKEDQDGLAEFIEFAKRIDKKIKKRRRAI